MSYLSNRKRGCDTCSTMALGPMRIDARNGLRYYVGLCISDERGVLCWYKMTTTEQNDGESSSEIDEAMVLWGRCVVNSLKCTGIVLKFLLSSYPPYTHLQTFGPCGSLLFILLCSKICLSLRCTGISCFGAPGMTLLRFCQVK